MDIAVTGAGGFIGRRLIERLRAEGQTVSAMSLRAGAVQVPPSDAVVHLAGEPIAQRWSAEAKQRIRESRVAGTRRLVEALGSAGKRPSVFVCASAVGIYGSRGDEVLTEKSAAGTDFLAEVCADWERAAEEASSLGARVVKLRFGVVLGRGGGALARMLPAFRLGAGGRLASGRQWMSWIHLDDAAGLIRFAIGSPGLRGAVNATAPNPVRNADFTRQLARTLHRPAFAAVPGLALKLLFGEMAGVLTGSQRAIPEAARAAGYRFQFPDLAAALEEILRHPE